MYHQLDTHLHRIVAWDADTKEPCSSEVICQECDIKERKETTDVNFNGDRLCKQKGCPNNSNEFSDYCDKCYDEKYPDLLN